MIKKICLAIFVSMCLVNISYALEPMRIKVRTELPVELKTVGEAAQYYADSVGYKLITEYPAPPESANIAHETIDPNVRIINVLPIEESILELLAQDYLLVIDNKNKLFSFQRRESE